MIDHEAVIQGVQTSMASISIISCLYMAYKIRKEGSGNIANRMLSFLFMMNFILALAYAVGRAAIPVHGFCEFQALIIQWFSLATILWAVLMAYQMREWIVAKKHPKRIDSAMRSYMMLIVVSTGIMAISLLGGGVYGEAYLWCWVSSNYQLIRFCCFDIILFGSWILIAYYLWEVSKAIIIRQKRSSMNAKVVELLAGQTSVQRKLMLYVGIFVFVWFFAILNRLLEWGLGRPIFATSVIQVVVLPLQGFFNALAFGDALGWLNYMGISDQTTDNVVLNKDIKPTEELREVLKDPPKVDLTLKRSLSPTHRQTKKYVPKQYSIFTTTLNMGEASLQSMLPQLGEWIVEGHDVYAVGVQECLDLKGVSDAILAHLGGHTKYSRYSTAIGSGNTTLGYHGYIALMLFVKVTELKAGHIVPTVPSVSTMATGADLIVTTAQNKGAVGLPLQIHDTSITFVTCHLPSDSKGKSKLSKRNASAHSILKELILAPEDVGFDLHLQHDHVLVFGDLNYRMDSAASGGGMGSLTGVAVACLIEKSAMADDENWLRRKYNLMRNPVDPLFPNIEEIKLIKAARANSRGAWSSVLRADELRSIMSDGDAFSGFDEPMPCFPPSYKRKKGDAEGDCGDYTDPLKIIQGFTNTGEVQELSRNSDGTEQQQRQTIEAKKLRPPSYTDRILIHSLPDRQERLTVQSYDCCDRLRISDHRAVSMTIRLEVNTAVQFQNHSPVDSGGGTSEDSNIDPAKEPKFQLYELAISNLCVTFDSSATGTAAEDEDSDSEEEDGSIDRLDSSSQDDADSPKNQFVGFAGNSNSNSASEKSGGEVFTSTNPLHGAMGRSLVSDVKVAKSRPASSKGVSFASEPPPSEGIEMSPSASATTSPLPSPRHSPPQSPSASPSPSPTPSPSQSPSRPAMLGRSRSANSAALNATAPTALTVTTTTESNSNSNMNTEDSTSSSTSSSFSPTPAAPQARPRFLSRLSLLPSSLSSSSKERESEPILSAEGGARRPRFLTMDRQKSDNMLSKSLVKNRNRSIFGAFMKTEKAPEPTPQDEEGDIIDELSRDSMSWEGGDHGGGNWRRRLEQEEAERKLANKKRSVKIVSKIKKKTKKLKKNDKKVHQVVIVFPLPAKDPLLAHRKLYDFSKAYNLGADAADDIESNLRAASQASESSKQQQQQQGVTTEQLLRPLNVFTWIEDPSSKSRPGSLKRKGAAGESVDRASSATAATDRTSSPMRPSSGRLNANTTNTYKVTGCASPELGAHVLLKFLNRSGYELGSTVVSLTHLLHTSTEEVHATLYTNVSSMARFFP